MLSATSSPPPVASLQCKPMTYAWGKKGSSSAVAQLARQPIDENTAYAELWMGAHPNAPSVVELPSAKGGSVPLHELLRSHIDHYLPPAIRHYNNNELPFLFKVLSIRTALSIQAHPDKSLAAQLHRDKPDVYRDGNHKPEMAVALTDFESLYGFRPLQETSAHLKEYPELRAVVGDEVASAFTRAVDAGSGDEKRQLRALFTALMSADEKRVAEQITALIARLEKKQQQATEIDRLLIRLNEQYPKDVGVLCVLLMNYVKMAPGEGMYMGANVLHAYISGDCVECMAASDNVVRAGLTPKLKDVPTLTSMLTYEYGPARATILHPSPYHGSNSKKQATPNTVVYDPPIPEFTILSTSLSQSNSERVPGIQGPSVLICTEGQGQLRVVGNSAATDGEWKTEFKLERGTVLFLAPDVDVEMTATADKLTVYRAYCDGHE
ncbi:Mannose-6-phosphate isomerase [Sorochytrium milnesiophthora]